MELVELPPRLLPSHPRRLSGGQQQRVAIARALAMEPSVLIADEATAALDVSVQAAILKLFSRLKDQLGLTLIFISHDLAVVRHLCDRVAVMYLGRIVEEAETDAIFENPRHPYTRALLKAVPRMHSRKRAGESALQGELPNAAAIPTGCRFHPRCPLKVEACVQIDPRIETRQRHSVACLLGWERPDLETSTEPPAFRSLEI